MKKLLLASAVAALSISAQAAPTVYGKAFLTLDAGTQETKVKATGVKLDTDERTKLNSNTSRIGVKGSESVTANTDVVYQLEYGVDIDANNNGKGQFYSRDTYIGLANKQFGTVLAGRLTGIDDMINYANVIDGGAATGNGILASYDGERANNAIAYVSPNYSGLNFLGMYVLDENIPTTDTFNRDAFGVGVQYEPQGANYRGGATYIQAGDTKITRLSGAVDMNANVTVGALYQNLNGGKGVSKENTVSVSGTFKTATPWTAYAQLDLVDNYGNVKDAEAQRIAVGGKYAFNKGVIGHVYGAVGKGEDQLNETKAASLGAGVEYKF